MGHEIEYYKIREEVHWIPRKTLPWSHKCLYGRLSFRCNHKNKSWWSNEKLAIDMQTTGRTIQKWCRRLEELHLIKVHRREGSRNEISMPEPHEQEWLQLGVPPSILRRLREKRGVRADTGGVSKLTRGDVQMDTPIIKGKAKTKSKTCGRVSLDSLWGDEDVQASGKRAVAASEKRGAVGCIPTMDDLRAASPPEEAAPLPDEHRLARWSMKEWSSAFVAAMGAQGYEISFSKYKVIQNHVGAIRDHLLNRGFSRLKIYRFLLEWFPTAYPSICSSVFKKSSEDFMFSVSWMEPRLDELVRLYEERDSEPRRAPKVTVMD